MLFKILFYRKCFFTLFTFIWSPFLPSVCYQTMFKITFLCKTNVTPAALIGFLTRVCLHMFCRNRIHREKFVKKAALIWIIPYVYPKLCYEMTTFFKYLFIQCVSSSVVLDPILVFLQCIIICFLGWFFYEKGFLTQAAWMRVFLVCAKRCVMSWLLWNKAFPYWLHWNGLMPLCFLICLLI